jgi:hypothetical protein
LDIALGGPRRRPCGTTARPGRRRAVEGWDGRDPMRAARPFLRRAARVPGGTRMRSKVRGRLGHPIPGRTAGPVRMAVSRVEVVARDPEPGRTAGPVRMAVSRVDVHGVDGRP